MKFPAWKQVVACFHVWYLIFQVGKLFDFPASAHKQRLFVIISGGTFPGKARKGRHQTSPPANKFTFIIITLWWSDKFRAKQNSGQFSPRKSIVWILLLYKFFGFSSFSAFRCPNWEPTLMHRSNQTFTYNCLFQKYSDILNIQ